MKLLYKKVYSKLVETQWDSLVWDEGLLKEHRRGHTKESNLHEYCHDARSSAAWYSIGMVTGKIGEQEGLEILYALEMQQVTDIHSPHYGGMRWYREESKTYDTNGAFFTQRSLLITRKMILEYLPDSHKLIIDRILNRGAQWFARELILPIFYYSNKILSDGAMLMGIASVTGNKEHYALAKAFFINWIDYTNTRGWGWGENLSIGYNGVIFSAFKLALLSLEPADTKLKAELEKIMHAQLEFFRFYNGYEVTPAIRNYNYDGQARRWSLVYNLAHVAGNGIEDNDTLSASDAVCLITLFNDELYYNVQDYNFRGLGNNQEIPRVQVTRIFDDKCSYSWVGQNGSMGTINQFPVIDGSYQHPTWGLGWQCMPVNFVVNEAQTSYLRWRVNTGENVRYHPKHNYLSPALFEENHFPDVTTSCKQKNNVCVAMRSMKNVSNCVIEISDELFVPRFGEYDTQVREITAADRQWTAISFHAATVLISPLLGVSYQKQSKASLDEKLYKADSMEVLRYENAPRTQGVIEIIQEDEGLMLRQICYTGDTGTFTCERIEVGWLMMFIDRQMTALDLTDYLNTITVNDVSRIDGYAPRTSSYELHEICVTKDEKELLQYTFDPYCI